MIKRFDFKLWAKLVNFCFAHISTSIDHTPYIMYNISLVVWGGHKNPKDLMYRSWDMSKTKIQTKFFLAQPDEEFIWNLEQGSKKIVFCWPTSKVVWVKELFLIVYRLFVAFFANFRKRVTGEIKLKQYFC